LLTGWVACFAQKPVIRAVDKAKASNAEVVTLQGSFNGDATKVSVSMGAMKAPVQFISDQLLEVTVPAGATYENIVVTDLTSGLSDESAAPVLLSFGGNHGVGAASLEGQVDFDSESGLYDLCTCDFDSDGRTDIATANDNSNTLTLFANTTAASGLASISFNRIPILIGTRSIHARCGDLNGDGKPDLVISEGGSSGDRIFVFRNTSTGMGVFTFSIQAIQLTGKKVKRIEIADLDNNGKPEIIVSNQTGNNIAVLVNESTLAAITFNATPLNVNISGAASTDGLQVKDLDDDGLPEIVTSQFLTATSNIFILKNTSIPGNISFSANTTLSLSGTVVNIRIGDLTGDNKPEIAATQLLGSGISIFKNQSTTTPSFAAPVSILTDDRPWGIDFGDLDGDGLTDIVVASLTKKSVTILNNESILGSLAFAPFVRNTTFINRHVRIGDVDGDGKPDIAFTSVDDNNNNILSSKVSILRNKNCLVPVVTPGNAVTICVGFPYQLKTTPSRGTTYVWKDGAATVKSGPDPFFDVILAGNYSVTATGEGGTCSQTSNTVAIAVDPGITSGPAIPTNDGPVCVGSTLSLAVNDVTATAYNWRGPAGYTGTGLIPAPIVNFQNQNAGRYFLDVVVNTCIAQQVSTVVSTIGVPDFQVSFPGSDIVCVPDTKTLTIVPIDPDYSYQWAERVSGNIGGATGTSTVVSASGKYFVKAQYIPNPACASLETNDAIITFSTTPVVDFSAPGSGCVGQNLTFTNQSISDGAIPKFYSWSFGDSQSASIENPIHQYGTASTFGVTLKVSYNNGACESQVTKNVDVQSAPAATITTPGNNFQFCPGDSLRLEIPGAFATYQWNTGESTPFIFVKIPGSFDVNVTTATCTLNATVTVDTLQRPVVLVTADPLEVIEGGSSQLTASGLDTYSWTPPDNLSDPAISNPVATPTGTTLYTVTGTDSNGCIGQATVEVSVKGDIIVNKLTPSKFFSPDNGDDINNFWLIQKILDYPQCQVTVYDDKGIKVYESKPYVEDWNGTYKGKPLPDGVYYYIIRCDGEEKTPKSGSITLLR
jgi:gliding motility-associated-like protein